MEPYPTYLSRLIDDPINEAINNRRLEEVKRLYNRRKKKDPKRIIGAMPLIISRGGLEIIKFFYNEHPENLVTMMSMTGFFGNVESIKWFLSIGHSILLPYNKLAHKSVIRVYHEARLTRKYDVTSFIKELLIRRAYYRAWLPMRSKKIFWKIIRNRKYYIHQAIKANPGRINLENPQLEDLGLCGIDYLRDLRDAIALNK